VKTRESDTPNSLPSPGDDPSWTQSQVGIITTTLTTPQKEDLHHLLDFEGIKISKLSLSLCLQDKKLISLVSSRRKSSKKSDDNDGDDDCQDIDWEQIASSMGLPSRTAAECKDRYQHLRGTQAGKGPWTSEEDRKITHMVQVHGEYIWTPCLSVTPASDILSHVLTRRSKKVEHHRSSTSWPNWKAMS
jgi:hypothetical protein